MGSKRAFFSRKFEQNQTTYGQDMKTGPLGTVLTILWIALSAIAKVTLMPERTLTPIMTKFKTRAHHKFSELSKLIRYRLRLNSHRLERLTNFSQMTKLSLPNSTKLASVAL